MSNIEILLTAISLSADAFAVSICKGLSFKEVKFKNALVVSLYFGIFQAIMPIIGYLLGTSLETIIITIDHWIALCLLTLIGTNMIIESLSPKEQLNNKTNFKTMLPLSISTSIDALAIGITFSIEKVNIMLSSTIIGTITFLVCIIGVLLGNKIGTKYQKISTIIGGILLIVLGIKILLQHLYII